MFARALRQGLRGRGRRVRWVSVNYVHICASPTPNPHAYMFQSMDNSNSLEHYLEHELDRSSPRQFSSIENAEKHSSLAAEVLCNSPHVESVFLGDDFLTVQKVSNADWEDLAADIEKTIHDFLDDYREKGPNVTRKKESSSDTGRFETNTNLPPEHPDKELAQEIENCINEFAKPHVQSDGGDVKFVMIDRDGVVHLQMLGACVSCPSSTVTVRFMIKNMLQHYFDEVTDCVHVDWEE